MSIYSCYYFVQKINLKRKLFLLKVGEVLAVGEIRRITVVFCKVGFPWNCFKAATEFQNRIWKHHQQTQKHKKKKQVSPIRWMKPAAVHHMDMNIATN